MPPPEYIMKRVHCVDLGFGSPCWIWIGGKLNIKGYGQTAFEGRGYNAHRLSYLIFKGDIPAGLVIDHLCENKACANPDHLEAVTTRENVRRGRSAEANRLRHKRWVRASADVEKAVHNMWAITL